MIHVCFWNDLHLYVHPFLGGKFLYPTVAFDHDVLVHSTGLILCKLTLCSGGIFLYVWAACGGCVVFFFSCVFLVKCRMDM